MFVFEGTERVSSPYDHNKEYILYINPSRSKVKHLAKTKIAVRGLVLGDGRTFVAVDGSKCDHDMMRQNLTDDLGYDEAIVRDSYELFITDINSQEGSYYTDKVVIGDMNVFYRGVESGGMEFNQLLKINFGVKAAFGTLSESETKELINLILEDELMEASIGKQITAIAMSLGLVLSSVVAPFRAVTSNSSATQAVQQAASEDQPIVIDPETFERWMTEPSHDELEHKSMQDAQDEYDFNAMVQSEDFIYLALTMWGEARSHGELGMRAVGHVIVNRVAVNANMYGGNTIRGVTLRDRQFSCWNEGDPNRDRMLNIENVDPATPDGQAWKLSQAIAIQILTGNSEDPTGGALMYHASRVTPFWVEDDRNVEVARIADHIFYVDRRWI